MNFNPFIFKDGADFLHKMGFTIEKGLAFLDKELEKRKEVERNECRGTKTIS